MDVTDPVCGMRLHAEKAAAREDHGGRAYFFCSNTCHQLFRLSPERFARDEIAKEESEERKPIDRAAEAAASSRSSSKSATVLHRPFGYWRPPRSTVKQSVKLG
jgi:YHS domain-containing protein